MAQTLANRAREANEFYHLGFTPEWASVARTGRLTVRSFLDPASRVTSACPAGLSESSRVAAMNDFRLKILLARGFSRLPTLLLGSGDFVELALPAETPVSDVDPEDSGPSRLNRGLPRRDPGDSAFFNEWLFVEESSWGPHQSSTS